MKLHDVPLLYINNWVNLISRHKPTLRNYYPLLEQNLYYYNAKKQCQTKEKNEPLWLEATSSKVEAVGEREERDLEMQAESCVRSIDNGARWLLLVSVAFSLSYDDASLVQRALDNRSR